MTIQQLEYIVALERYGHFLQAAEACGITQPTLSATIAKLEEELDTQIFDRSRHPIVPTDAGWAIIKQAKTILQNVETMKELVLSEREKESGEVRMGVIPTISPYILPSFIKQIQDNYPLINLHITESVPDAILLALNKAEIDMAIMSPTNTDTDILEIPLYTERFVAYVSPNDNLARQKDVYQNDLATSKIWLLNESLCMTEQLKNIMNIASNYSSLYRAGTVDTLIRIVEKNGGFSLIPELHLDLLRDYQRHNVRHIVTPDLKRTVCLFVRKDFVKEKLLNIIVNIICRIIPEPMLMHNLKDKYIRL